MMSSEDEDKMEKPPIGEEEKTTSQEDACWIHKLAQAAVMLQWSDEIRTKGNRWYSAWAQLLKCTDSY